MSTPSPPVQWGEVAAWAVGGFVLEWVVIFFYALTQISSGGGTVAGGIAAFCIVPAVCALLLLHPRTRRAAAATLLGIAIGSVVGAGACVGIAVSLGEN